MDTELGEIPLWQTSGSDTEYVEIRITNDKVKNYRKLLSTEAPRLNVPEPRTKDILKVTVIGDYSIAETTFIFRVKELPQLLLLLESGWQNRELYTFIATGSPSMCASQNSMTV
jgi:hypothetical protein